MRIKIINKIIVTIAIFTLISAPSIKIFYSSVIINLIPLFFLLFYYFTNINNLFKRKSNKKAIFVYSISIVVFLLYFLFGRYSVIDADVLFRYTFLITVLFLLSSLVDFVNKKMLIGMIISWAILISTLKLFEKLSYSSDLGQTYLTVGLPMGAGLTASLILLFFSKKKFFSYEKILILICSGIILTGLLFSRGRSNLLYPLFVFVFTVGGAILYNKSFRLKYLFFISLILFFAVSFITSNAYNSDFTSLNRLSASSVDISEEDRLMKWTKSFDYILDYPFFGYGVDSSYYLIGNYPHNIFIELALSFGIPVFILFFIFIMKYLIAYIRQFSIEKMSLEMLCIGAIGMYFFVSWNTSFDLGTSYIPLSLILLFKIYSYEYRKK